MKKTILFISSLFTQSLFAQVILTPFIPNIGHTGFTQSLDAYGNEIVAYSSFPHDLSQSRIFVFEKNGGTITQETYFTPADAALNDAFGSGTYGSDGFGNGVSIYNDFIAAGSRLHDQVATDAGAVYLYRKVSGNWQFFQKITAFDGSADDSFGGTVKIVGNQLFVVAPNDEAIGLPANTNSGGIYIYKFDGTTWNFSQKLTGRSLKIDNNRMVVSNSSLQTYDYDGNNWIPSSISNFVGSVMDYNLDNGQLFIMPSSANNSQIQIYDAGANSWNLNTTLAPLNLYDKYATNFIVRDNIMLVSLNFHALLYTARTPTAVYRKIDGTWTFQEYVYGQGQSDRDDSFGTRMAISNSIIVIGAPNEFLPNADGGRAYTVDVALAIHGNPLENATVYPNPTNGELFLTENMLANLKAIEVYQTDGKLVSEIQPIQNSVMLNDLQKGLYLLKFVYNNNTSLTKKIAKN